MNPAPDIAPTSMKLLLMLSVAIGCIVIMTIAISGRRLPEIFRSIAKLLVVGVFVLVIGGFVFWARGVPVQAAAQLEIHQQAVERHSSGSIESSAFESPLSVVAGEVESTKSEVERPEWTRQPVRIDGGRKLIVVSSGRFASDKEAELHGFQQAAAAAVKEYSALDPRGSGAVQPQHADVVKQTAIKQRFLEIAQHDFGKFQAPMHQLWLQVELTSELGERLAKPWRQAAVEARLRTLTGWSVWGTAAAALAAFSLRLDSAWNGRRRAVVAGTAIVLTLGSLAFLA